MASGPSDSSLGSGFPAATFTPRSSEPTSRPDSAEGASVSTLRTLRWVGSAQPDRVPGVPAPRRRGPGALPAGGPRTGVRNLPTPAPLPAHSCRRTPRRVPGSDTTSPHERPSLHPPPPGLCAVGTPATVLVSICSEPVAAHGTVRARSRWLWASVGDTHRMCFRLEVLSARGAFIRASPCGIKERLQQRELPV